MTIGVNQRPQIETHVIPTNELIRNANWLSDAGMPGLLKTINDARVAQQQYGLTAVQTEFENFTEDEYADIEVLYFAMLLQNMNLKSYMPRVDKMVEALKYTSMSGPIQNSVFAMADSIQEKIYNEVYTTNPVDASKRVISDKLNDYVENSMASAEEKLGLN
jgi:hypothetical protein